MSVESDTERLIKEWKALGVVWPRKVTKNAGNNWGDNTNHG